MQNKEPQFEILHMPPTNTNSLLVTMGDACVIFDAWGRGDAWEKLLTERGLCLRAIYSTHGHPDHISAAQYLAQKFDVPWYMNSADNDLIGWGNELLDYFQIPRINPAGARPQNLPGGKFEILPGIWLDAIETPGHSAGGMSFYFPDYKILLTGDTLFHDGVGRCDLPGGNMCDLRKSISKLHDMKFPAETFVVHGHGMDSTIGGLVAGNPYFRPCDDCCGGGHCHGDNHCCCGHK